MFNSISVKVRLAATLGLVLCLMLISIVTSVWSGRLASIEIEGMMSSEFKKYELVAEIDSATKANARNTLELFVVEADKRAVVRDRMQERKQRIDALLDELNPLIVLPKGRLLFDQLVVERKAYVAAFTKASELLKTEQLDDARVVLNGSVLPQIDKLNAPVVALLELQRELAQTRVHSIRSSMQHQIQLSLALGAVALVLGIVSSWLLIRAIMGPLLIAHRVADEIGKGNLTVDIEIRGENEFSDMLLTMHHMKEHLAHVMVRIQESANSVAAASTEIAAANLDLSARTEAQASSLEQTAAAMEQMTGSVHQNAVTTQVANQLAVAATGSAGQVGDMVEHLVKTMHGIHESSNRIRDIVGVIDSIAFQTNILALNAAVEAARAGEQGKGFAVVAVEVRHLAQRSALAAQEIKKIITENVEKMEVGSHIATQAGESVVVALDSIRKVSSTVAEVDVATREQSQGIAQVGQAIEQLDNTTQQNAALVEQTAAATQNLDSQVQSLKNQISRFKIA